MDLSKKYYRVKATSLLESVIALTVVSICLYIAILVFAAVFTPKTSVKFYSTQNRVNAWFYQIQIQKDSITTANQKGMRLEEEVITEGLKRITIHYKDSTNADFEKSFYIQENE